MYVNIKNNKFIKNVNVKIIKWNEKFPKVPTLKNLKESKIHGPNIHKFYKNFMRKIR